MSFQRMLRGFFTARPTPVTYNPYKPFYKWMRRLRRNWWKWLGGVIIFFFITGSFLRLTGVFSIYEEEQVEAVRGKKYAGGLFDWIWYLRGQPPGWESQPSGFGTTPSFGDKGYLNGPTNYIFLPFEFLFVDCLVYLPGFFFGAIDISNPLNILDLPKFALTIAVKAMSDFFLLLVALIPLIVLGFLLTFFGPFVLMRLFQSGNILLRLIGAVLVAIPIITVAMIIIMGPEGLIDFVNELFGKTKELYEGGP